MLGSEILEVAIGLFLVYLLLSLICSAVRELIESAMNKRGADLLRGIEELLRRTDGKVDDGLVEAIYRHPLVSPLYRGHVGATVRSLGRRLPAYIPPRSFALALLDLVTRGPGSKPHEDAAAVLDVESVRGSLARVENDAVRRAVTIALDRAEGSLARVQADIEAWFDSSMNRVSSWYKAHTQWILFGLGLLAAVVLNINTLVIADALAQDDALRQVLIAEAERVASAEAAPTGDAHERYEQLTSLGLPIGWEHGWLGPWRPLGWSFDVDEVLTIAFGWLLTAFAVTFGAPFWFDLLDRFMAVRTAMKPRERPNPDATPPTASPRRSVV